MTTTMTHNILARELNFPEGPAFDSTGALWCVELKGGNLVRLHDGQLTRIATGGAPNGIAIDAHDRVWFCDSQQMAIRLFDPRARNFTTLADRVDGQPLNKPNDLAFDAAGNLIFTCPGDSRTEPTGCVCVRRPDGAVHKIAENLFFPNGLALLDHGRSLVIAETYQQRLWRGAWDAQHARWQKPAIWAGDLIGKPGPDGMALAADGRLYVAVYGAQTIKVLDARGQQIGQYELPGRNPTNCAFDPLGRYGLVVTEAEKGLLISLPEPGPGAPLFQMKDATHV